MAVGVVVLWLSGSALAGGVTSPVAVFPPHNATGEAGLDWVAVGLQDSLTVNLWYVSALHTKAMPQFSETLRERCPEMALSCVAGQNLADWRQLAQAQTYGGFLWGEYRREGEEWVLRLGWYDAQAERPLTEQTVRRRSLPEVLAASSDALLVVLANRGIAVSDAERDRIRAPQTTVLVAWEQNARGFWEQQRYHVAHEDVQRQGIQIAWERDLRAAVQADPDYAEAWNNLGWQQHIVKTASKADRSSPCLPADGLPESANPMNETGALNTDAIFQLALQRKPEMVDALVGRGEALQKKPVEALPWYERAVALNPSLAYHRQLLLDTYLEAKLPKAGLAQLMVLDEQLRRLGREAERQALNDWRGRYHEALQQWSQALAVYEDWDTYLAQSGDAACRQCRLDLAIRLRVTGENLAKQNQPQEAEAYLRRALAIREAVLGTELAAATRLTLKALAEVVEQQGRIDEARVLLERAEANLAQVLATQKQKLGGDALQGVVRDWWQAFEKENAGQEITILLLFEELESRQASLDDFFQAYVNSEANSIPGVLSFMDQQPVKTMPPASTL
ncbi:MAG: tetratricopeptide repeat protein [Candidatus Contendobacter sp.]|nr:tetratricopeptide repeat protein [Candidatus Contendobacter sp.]